MSMTAAVNFFNPVGDADDSPPGPRLQPSPTLRKTDTAQELRNASLQSVDSDMFDSEGFRMALATAGTNGTHVVTSPFEVAQYPIEINESKKQRQREISNRDTCCRARMESFQQQQSDSVCLSPLSPHTLNGSYPDVGDPEPRSKSPQLVECHTFRDAIDVNFQRMAITGEEISGVGPLSSFKQSVQVPLENLQAAASQLIRGMALREEYMERIGHSFPVTTKNFISGKYPAQLPRVRRKNTENSSVNVCYNPPSAPDDHWGLQQPLPTFDVKYTLRRAKGVVELLGEDGKLAKEFESFYMTKEKFLRDFQTLTDMTIDGELKSFCFRRLTFLANKYQLHVLLNEMRELHEQKSVPHRDFYNIRKVDTHIHAASSMNQKHLLRFIKKKLRTESNAVVLKKEESLIWGGFVNSSLPGSLGSKPTTPQQTIDVPDTPPPPPEEEGVGITLREVFKKMNIDSYDMSVDMLDVHADRNTFHRFDKFNSKYNPVGESTLREIFIKTDNFVGGKYFAEVLKEVLSDLEDSKYQHAEPRLSIYGRSKDEWDKLAKWALTHDVWSPNVRWLVQIPRLYDVYKQSNMVRTFDEILDNVFTPLFEATNDPSSHPELYRFLQCVSGIDSVDDESKHEAILFDEATPGPEGYDLKENPPYSYYLFYMYKNLCVLNALRRARGMSTFALRPHCGEAGGVSHLMAAFLTSESIAHGLMLRKVPVMQYLFYLTGMGIAMSPLSNNSLFISYQRSPLPDYFQKGLNISLSTDDPLQFHYTKEALMEEYSIAAQVFKLSSCDMCELARNSVLQSGFEDKVKIHWLGPNYKEEGVLGNDITRTNVPDIRVAYRHEALVDELLNLFNAVKNRP